MGFDVLDQFIQFSIIHDIPRDVRTNPAVQNIKHFISGAFRTLLSQLPVCLDMLMMFLDETDDLRHADVLIRDDLLDWRTPFLHYAIEIEHHVDFCHQLISSIVIRFVDGKDISDFEYACLYGLDIITHARDQHYHGRIRRLDDIDLRLSDTNGFDKDDILAKSIQCLDGIGRLMGQPAKTAACSHAPDEYALIEGQSIHTDAVT